MAAAGSAYLAAVDASMPAWQAIDAMLTANNGDVYRDDLLTQVDADAPFLAALVAIQFPPDAAPAANELVAAVQAYDAFLTTEYENFGTYGWYTAQDEQLRQTRADSSAHLRDVLGLPASTAMLRRP